VLRVTAYLQHVAVHRESPTKGRFYGSDALDTLYFKGLGVQVDYAQAMAWYRKTADQGVPAAIYSIGFIYDGSFGAPKDPKQAGAWMNKAAAAGSDEAKKWLLSH
jgi:TPR repeat protein